MKVREIVDLIIASCETMHLPQTCDQLMAGDWECEVTGIVSTFMATVDVIKEAIEKQANLIITHEPTYFTGPDTIEWLKDDEVYLAKKRLIDDHKMNIWRFHDHMHMTSPDKIYIGLNKELDWEKYAVPEKRHCYTIPPTTTPHLAAFLKEKLGLTIVRIVGDPEATVSKVGILVGGGSLGLGSEHMPMELMRNENLDLIVCGEILEWTLCAYVRDAAQLGFKKSLIIAGHNRTEEVGMKHLPEWLTELMPDIPVHFIESGEPFTYF
jgi:putative NIF3 family GTP cyclohydrolase 1 type 2